MPRLGAGGGGAGRGAARRPRRRHAPCSAPRPPPLAARRSSGAAGAERCGGGGAQGREGRRSRAHRAERAGRRWSPPACPGPRAAPPPATPAALGGPRSAQRRGNRSRSRRREQRAGAPDARMQGERRRPGPWGRTGRRTPGGGHGGKGGGFPRSLGRGVRTKGHERRLALASPQLGDLQGNFPGASPSLRPLASGPGNAVPGGSQGTGAGRSGDPEPAPAQRNPEGSGGRSPARFPRQPLGRALGVGQDLGDPLGTSTREHASRSRGCTSRGGIGTPGGWDCRGGDWGGACRRCPGLAVRVPPWATARPDPVEQIGCSAGGDQRGGGSRGAARARGILSSSGFSLLRNGASRLRGLIGPEP